MSDSCHIYITTELSHQYLKIIKAKMTYIRLGTELSCNKGTGIVKWGEWPL